MHIYTIMIITTFNRQAINMYMYTGWHITWRNPLAFLLPHRWFPFASLLFPFTYLETLLGVIGSRPPRSQVTRKQTSPLLPPPHSNFPVPRLIAPLTTTTSWSQLLVVRNTTYLFLVLTVHCNRSFDTVPLNHRIYADYCWRIFTGFSFIQKNGDRGIDFWPMDRYHRLKVNRWINGHRFDKDFVIDDRYYLFRIARVEYSRGRRC
jgi:hypothetical protein